MSQVTFPPELGGDGNTYSDDSNPATGLANGGWRTRFIPALAQVVKMALSARGAANAAAASAASAIAAPGSSATSATEVTVGLGVKNFVIQPGKGFVLGQFVIAASAANVKVFVFGQITAHDTATGALSIDSIFSGGTVGTVKSDWIISLQAPATFERVVRATANVTLRPGDICLIEVDGIDISLPETINPGDLFRFVNRSGGVASRILCNGNKVEGRAEDIAITRPFARFSLKSIDAATGVIFQ